MPASTCPTSRGTTSSSSSGRPEDWFIGQAHVFEEKDAYDILKPKYRVGPTAREVAAPDL